MEVVEYSVNGNILTVGFKEDNFVVFSSISFDVKKTKEDLLQKAYVQVRDTIEYEKTLDNHSFITDKTGEVFIPEPPKVKDIEIMGDSFVVFDDNIPEKILTFTATAYDQYGDVIQRDFEWVGCEKGVIVVPNEDGEYEISVGTDGIYTSLKVIVFGYQKPLNIQLDESKTRITDLELNMAEIIALI